MSHYIKDIIALSTLLWVLQESENIIRPTVYCETQILVQLWKLDHKMWIPVNYNSQRHY